MRLTDDELREVLARAEEIHGASRQGAEWHAERAALVGAAVEIGLSREAIELALDERFKLSSAVGALTWARSADGKYYVAEVLEKFDHGARVRFLRGSEHRVSLDQLRPCAFLPGERIVCNWPWWGQWTGTVNTYDPVNRRVELSDGWGETHTFPVSEVWLPPDKTTSSGRARVYATLIGVGAVAGALIGSIITAIAMR